MKKSISIGKLSDDEDMNNYTLSPEAISKFYPSGAIREKIRPD